MSGYWFVLGREPLLSTAEIASILNTTDYRLEPGILKLSLANFSQESATTLMNRLGGTIKLALELGTNLTETELLEAMEEELKTVQGKIHFGLSWYENEPRTINHKQSVDTVYRWGKTIKQNLKGAGLSVRHVFNREAVLSSVTVEKNGLTKRGREFLITRSQDFASPPARGGVRGGGSITLYSLAKTLAVQPFEAFGARDFGRPGRDDVSGMLPPKLALMMLNISGAAAEETLLDPFCGSGTILTEAKLLGFQHLIGSDISDKAIEDTKKNLEWIAVVPGSPNYAKAPLGKQFPVPSLSVFVADSSNLSTHVKSASIDTIVTEPYLGKPLKGHENEAILYSQAAELKQLYRQAFSEFYKLLKPGGRIVFIIPRFKTRAGWLRIECVEEIKKLGFKSAPVLPEHDFLLYARSDQRVGREIWRFEKII